MERLNCPRCGERCYLAENEYGEVMSGEVMYRPTTSLSMMVRGDGICEWCYAKENQEN